MKLFTSVKDIASTGIATKSLLIVVSILVGIVIAEAAALYYYTSKVQSQTSTITQLKGDLLIAVQSNKLGTESCGVTGSSAVNLINGLTKRYNDQKDIDDQLADELILIDQHAQAVPILPIPPESEAEAESLLRPATASAPEPVVLNGLASKTRAEASLRALWSTYCLQADVNSACDVSKL